MKKWTLAVIALTVLCSCSKDDNKDNNTFVAPAVTAATLETNGITYKQFFQESDADAARKGIIILAHGDGGDENDFTLNSQCLALAQNGYVAITTTYRSPDAGNQETVNANFKADIEAVITKCRNDFDIPRSKVIIGGTSRGGNLTFSLLLPNQPGVTPIQGIKGAILQCSGGDNWKGSAVLLPVAYMSNLIDDVMDSNANKFQAGLNENQNENVSAMSACFIIPSTGHCTDANLYQEFLLDKVRQWLP